MSRWVALKFRFAQLSALRGESPLSRRSALKGFGRTPAPLGGSPKVSLYFFSATTLLAQMPERIMMYPRAALSSSAHWTKK